MPPWSYYSAPPSMSLGCHKWVEGTLLGWGTWGLRVVRGCERVSARGEAWFWAKTKKPSCGGLGFG